MFHCLCALIEELVMTQCMLLAVDGSQGGDRALEYSIAQVKDRGIKLVVAYVIEWSPYSFNTPEENAERHKRREGEISRAKKTIIDPAMEKLAGHNIKAESIVRHGAPVETLNELAKKNDVDQIVIGRRGQSGIKSLLFGSVAGSLIQTSEVPITVVP